MERYRGKYRSDSIRIRNWDYGSPGFYYVTICTEDREHYFGEVISCNDPVDPLREFRWMAPWDGMCGGIAGTHNNASLPPAAQPTHAPQPGYATKAYAKTHNIQFGWQPRFHDDVITSGQELDRIRKYIRDNPARWLQKQVQDGLANTH